MPIASQRSVDEPAICYQIINTVSSTLDLDRVLRAIVDLVSDAIDCHACFIYFVDARRRLARAAVGVRPYGALVGRLRFERGEGLAGLGGRATTSRYSSTDNALADPRVKIVPEAEEEDYQSLVAVPLRTRRATSSA